MKVAGLIVGIFGSVAGFIGAIFALLLGGIGAAFGAGFEFARATRPRYWRRS